MCMRRSLCRLNWQGKMLLSVALLRWFEQRGYCWHHWHFIDTKYLHYTPKPRWWRCEHLRGGWEYQVRVYECCHYEAVKEV